MSFLHICRIVGENGPEHRHIFTECTEERSLGISARQPANRQVRQDATRIVDRPPRCSAEDLGQLSRGAIAQGTLSIWLRW
jgi:hypothetical protein